MAKPIGVGKGVALPRKVVQIAVGEIRVGERALPQVFALTNDGEIFRLDPAMHEKPETWVPVRDIPKRAEGG